MSALAKLTIGALLLAAAAVHGYAQEADIEVIIVTASAKHAEPPVEKAAPPPALEPARLAFTDMPEADAMPQLSSIGASPRSER